MLKHSVKEVLQEAEKLSLNEEVESFFKKVSKNSATVEDLTPGVRKWLQDHQMQRKLKIMF